MTDGAVDPLDARGLMPLEAAREIVQSRAAFEKGHGRTIRNVHVLDSDLHWAALLSLEDAEEFVREASRLAWVMQPRGMANVAPFERYGADILPWLRSHLAEDPSSNVPWCVRPCLLAIESEEAFEVALGQGASSSDRRPFVLVWCAANPKRGYEWLLTRALAGDEVATQAAHRLADEDADTLFEHTRRWAGQRAEAIFDELGIPTSSVPMEARAVLAEAPARPIPRGPSVSLSAMDVVFAGYAYPMWDNANYFSGAMRVTGFVSPRGDALVFQSLMTGLGDGGILRQLQAFSPLLTGRAASSRQSTVLAEESIVRWNDDNSTTYLLTGAKRSAAGEWDCSELTTDRAFDLTLRGETVRVGLDFDAADLAPEGAERVRRSLGPAEWLMVHLGQAPFADRVFLTDAEMIAELGLPSDAVALFSFSNFEMPPADKPAASQSVDLVTMVAALRERRPITRLPSGKTALAQILERILVVDGWGDGWPPGLGGSTPPTQAKKVAAAKKKPAGKKKPAAKKPAAKKPAATKKPAAKMKPAAKKPDATKKAVTKKPAAKNAAKKKPGASAKNAPKKPGASAKKSVAKNKPASKKSVAKKSVAKKLVAKKKR